MSTSANAGDAELSEFDQWLIAGAPPAPAPEACRSRRADVALSGTTETGGLCSNGAVTDGVQLRLRDVPSMGYLTSDKPHPRGEVLARTPRMVRPQQRARRSTLAVRLQTCVG